MSTYSTKKKKSEGKLQKLATQKVPANPRYAHIKSSLDTGASLSKYLAKLKDVQINYRYQKGEIFKRMQVPKLALLILHVEKYKLAQMAGESITEVDEVVDEQGDHYVNETASETSECVGNGHTSPVPSLSVSETDYGDRPSTNRSTLMNLIGGVGEKDQNSTPSTHRNVYTVEPQLAPEDLASPYLLMDVRTDDEYDQCRLVGAIHFPKARLSRVMNYELPEMIQFKNRDGKIIVVYDVDETVAPEVATTLVERGYQNLYMLSGGIRVAYQKVPSLLTGTLPYAAYPQSLPQGSKGKKKEIVLDDHLRTSFTSEYLELLESHISNNFNDSLSSSSRMSRASDRASVVSSKSTASTPLWKP